VVLSVQHLRKLYGSTVAVDDVSFVIRPREIVGLLGPNGAGKTTTINMLLGVLEPTAGSVEIEGISVASHRSAAMQRTNFAAVYAPLPGNLTVEQNLKVFARMYGVRNRAAVIDGLIREFDLERLRATKCGVLSSGEQTRVALAKAMLNAPHLLLLDEPTASLDLGFQLEIQSLLTSLNRDRGVTMVLATHDLNLAASICSRLVLMSEGRVLAQGMTDDVLTPANIRQLYGVRADVQRHPGANHLTVVPLGRL
jgi:ABC-2 type transport system ATP-binding protein